MTKQVSGSATPNETGPHKAETMLIPLNESAERTSSAISPASTLPPIRETASTGIKTSEPGESKDFPLIIVIVIIAIVVVIALVILAIIIIICILRHKNEAQPGLELNGNEKGIKESGEMPGSEATQESEPTIAPTNEADNYVNIGGDNNVTSQLQTNGQIETSEANVAEMEKSATYSILPRGIEELPAPAESPPETDENMVENTY